MVAYGGGGRLMLIAPLIAVLGVIAMLPFSSCGKSPVDVDHSKQKYPACPKDFSQDLKYVSFTSSYLNINPIIHEGPESGYQLSLSKNVLSDGLYNGCASGVRFIAEVHPPYAEGLNPYNYAQLVVYEYLSDSRTIYITLRSALGYTYEVGGKQRKDGFFFYRMNCDELDPDHYKEILYENLFRETDTMMGLSRCFPNLNDISASQYGENRKNFIEYAYQEACGSLGRGDHSNKGLDLYDCYGLFSTIPEERGSSYDDVLNAKKLLGRPDPFAYTCPHLSTIVPPTDRLGNLSLREYYADAVHPLLYFNVTYFTIDLKADPKAPELKAKVLTTDSLITIAKDGLCPHDRMFNREFSGKGGMKLTSCDPQPILKYMADIDHRYRAAVTTYKAISISKGVVNDKPIFKSTPDMYRDERNNFAALWQSVCHGLRLFKPH